MGVVPVPLPGLPPVGAAPPGTWVDEQTVTYTVSGSPTAPPVVDGSAGASVEDGSVGASVEDGSVGASVEEGSTGASEEEVVVSSSAGGLAQRALVASRVLIWSAASQASCTQPMAALVIFDWFSVVHWQENSVCPQVVALEVASRMHWTCRMDGGLAGAAPDIWSFRIEFGRIQRTAQSGMPWVSTAATVAMRAAAAKVIEYFILID